MSRTFTALALVAALCSPPAVAAGKPVRQGVSQRGTSVAPPPSQKARARLVAAARRHVGKPFRGDCSGFVRRVYAAAGVPLPASARARSGTESIVRSLAPARRPRPGDVAYFHRTHDRDPPGRGRNLFTHIAVVESVDGPRVTLIHRSNRGVERLRMHLARRADPKVNGALRRRAANDPPTQPYLASQLLAGFASPFPTAQARRTPPPERSSERKARPSRRPLSSAGSAPAVSARSGTGR